MKKKSSRKQTSQKISYTFHRILSGLDLSRRRLPVMRATSATPGPVVWLTACAHGDEVGGMVVIQEVFKRLRKSPLRCGTLHAFPMMNPLGFEVGSRHVTLSEEDLNRSFPGDADGSLAERIAAHIFRHIVDTKPAAVLDLHNDWVRSIPYCVLDAPPTVKNKAYATAQLLAGETGMVVVVESAPEPRSLSRALLDCNIPALTLELGEAMVVVEHNVALGLESVWCVLTKLGLTEPAPIPIEIGVPEAARKRVLLYSSRPYSSTSGVIRFLCHPGDIVKGGQPVAQIYNAFGKLGETVKAHADAIVLGCSDSSVAYPGAPIMAFGVLR